MASSITVTYPTAGAVLVKNNTYTITWTATNVKPGVKIELYKGVANLGILINETPVSPEFSWNWLVSTSLTDGTDYSIKITGCEFVSPNCVAFPADFSPQFQITTSCTMPNCDFTTTVI